MSKKKRWAPRKCVVHCETTRKDLPTDKNSAAGKILDVAHAALDLGFSVISSQTLVIASSVADLVEKVLAETSEYGFDRLAIVDHSIMYVDKKGKPVAVAMHVGSDTLSGTNISQFSKELARLDSALTDDAEVKIVNCFVAADPVLHKGLAKAIKRPVIAGLGLTSGLGLTNDAGFFRADPDGTVKAVTTLGTGKLSF